MSSNDAPPAPDYSPLTNALQNIASVSAKNGADSLAWAKDQIAGNKDLIDKVNNNLLDLSSTSAKRSNEQYDAGKGLTDAGSAQLKSDYDKYSDPARKAADMGAAQAQVAQNFDAARQNSTQELESYGINPSATRFGALDIGVRAQQAAAAAGAGNVASRTDDALASNVNDKILAQGNQEKSLANGFTGTAATTATGAVNNNLANTASGGSLLGTDLAWTGAGTNATTGAVGATNTGYQNQLDKTKTDNSSSSGIGSLLGAGASMLGKGGALASGGALAFLEDGGPMPEPSQGAVPVEASPSGGAKTDDVNAKLNAGEFVFPKDVASWYGEEKLQKLIQKAREAKQGATAKPQMAVPAGPQPQQPNFVSRPAPQGAVPA
jgi:hypothetical protein